MSRAVKIALGAVAILATGAVVSIMYERAYMKQFFTEDAVQVIAYEIHDMLRENPNLTDNQIRSRIKFLHEASVINLTLDEDGNPLDPYGNQFRVIHQTHGDRITVSCTSAGPDGKFGTDDDIGYTDQTR